MIRSSWKVALLGILVVVAAGAFVSQAQAFHGGCCTPACGGCYSGCYGGCYSGCYGGSYSGYYGGCSLGCYSSCYGSSCYLGCRPGPIRRLVFGPYRWYCGYGCGYGCGGGYCGSGWCDTCTTASSCCGGQIQYDSAPMSAPTMMPPASSVPTPAMKPAPAPAAPAPAPAAAPATPAAPSAGPAAPTTWLEPTQETSGIVTIWVPAEAKVTINGLATRSTGSKRQYVSYGLKPGFSYKYEIKAEIVRDGQIVEEDRTVSITAGQRAAVAFGFNKPAEAVAAN
ncbi:MAG: TIGR03000 domain-containing protein [Thermoguttaceae bacterium]